MGYKVIIVEEKKKITKLRKGDTVRVHYTGTLENGKNSIRAEIEANHLNSN